MSVDLGSSIVQTMLGFQGLANSTDPAEKINNSAQLVAGLTSFLKIAESANLSLTAAVVNAGAALITAGKIEADLSEGNSPKLDDLISLAGNIAMLLAIGAINFTPEGAALKYILYAGRALGLLSIGKFLVDNAKADDSLITSLQTKVNTAETVVIHYDPLILDLNRDGIVGTTGVSKGTHFDNDGNGFAESTGWVAQGDGILVWDKNGNGQIDNGSELFGNYTEQADGSTAANGFAALAALDTNGDGKLDANDVDFANLKVWEDTNQDGVVDEGELLTLTDAGVQSLATGYTTQNVTDAQGNRHLQAGRFTFMDGTTAQMDDVWFAADTARSIPLGLIAVPADIEGMPDIAGFGNVYSLHQAMARDVTGRLLGVADRFAGDVRPANQNHFEQAA